MHIGFKQLCALARLGCTHKEGTSYSIQKLADEMHKNSSPFEKYSRFTAINFRSQILLKIVFKNVRIQTDLRQVSWNIKKINFVFIVEISVKEDCYSYA